MALFSILSLASFDEAPTFTSAGSESVVSARFAALPEPARVIPDSARPWFADYPLTTEIERARVYASDHRRIEDVRWRLGQFAAARIKLPTVEVWTHADATGCRFSLESEALFSGLYVQRNGVDTVYLCGTRFTVLHEHAHVHDNNFLTYVERDELLAIREADSWRNEQWHRAAGEHFADVVAWGLTAGEVRPSRSFPQRRQEPGKGIRSGLEHPRIGGLTPAPNKRPPGHPVPGGSSLSWSGSCSSSAA